MTLIFPPERRSFLINVFAREKARQIAAPDSQKTRLFKRRHILFSAAAEGILSVVVCHIAADAASAVTTVTAAATAARVPATGIRAGIAAGVAARVAPGVPAGITAGIAAGIAIGIAKGIAKGITAGIATGRQCRIAAPARLRAGTATAADTAADACAAQECTKETHITLSPSCVKTKAETFTLIICSKSLRWTPKTPCRDNFRVSRVLP